MFGRLSQLAQNVQNSFNADESGDGGPPPRNTASELEKTITRLQADLEQAEERNKSINVAFKKLLKQKEQEIKALKEGSGEKDPADVSTSSSESGPMLNEDLMNQLKRKTEEYQMLLEQKDETIQQLMADVNEAEDLRDKVEKQERINTEKLMFELAERIRAHEAIQRKLEETRHVMSEKDNAIHNMADQLAAQDELLKAREDSIKKLKRMAAGGQATEEMITTLQKSIHDKDEKLSQMAQLIDKLEVEKKLLDSKIDNRDGLETSKDQTIKTLWAEIEQKTEMIQKLSVENKDLMAKNSKKDEDLKAKLELVSEKENVIDELSMKVRSIESELKFKKSDTEVSSDHLKNQLDEMKEILKSKSQTINMFQKEIEEKDSVHTELRQKLNILQSSLDDKEENIQEQVKLCKNIEKEMVEFKSRYEEEVNEKCKLKEQLDKVGKELSEQLELESEKSEESMRKVERLEEESTQVRNERDEYANKLERLQEHSDKVSVEVVKRKEEIDVLESEIMQLKSDNLSISKDLDDVRSDLNAKVEELMSKNVLIESKDAEIQSQRVRFDEELSMLQTASENEKGSVVSMLQEMEHVRRELEAANQERDQTADENKRKETQLQKTIARLQELDSQIQELQDEMQSSKKENAKLKEEVGKFEDKIMEDQKAYVQLKEDLGRLNGELEREQLIKNQLEGEIERVNSEVSNTAEMHDEKTKQNTILREENSKLTEQLEMLQKQFEEAEVLKHNLLLEKEKEKEDSESRTSNLKMEYVELGEKVKEMEAAMNLMIERLNAAEMQMNESMREKDSVEEKLKLVLEEKVTLASQKSTIETALEEFVKSTGSRKKRSGRSSVDDSDGTRLTPNEALSGYNTPISKEGSPRNSGVFENVQAVAQPTSAGGFFEGKAISEIFKLVEEERNGLEANLSSVTKEKDALSIRLGELEDYLELERQKFKQASDEIAQHQFQSQQTEEACRDQIYSLQDELARIRNLNDALERKVEEDAESIDGYRQAIEKLEHELREVEDRLSDKNLELSRVNESCEHIQAELVSREEQLEKATKQNKLMKHKLKELLKEGAEKEKMMVEKDARIDELVGISGKLDKSLADIEVLEEEIRGKDAKILSLEEESSAKSSDAKLLAEKILKLEEDSNRFKEMSANELFAANEKSADLERSFREVEETRNVLKEEVQTRSREIEDLNSICSVQKEELGNLKDMIQRKEEELAVTKVGVDNHEQTVGELTMKLEAANASLQEKEDRLVALQCETEDARKNLFNANGEIESQKVQNTRQIEYISKLEEDLSEVNAELSKVQHELSEARLENETSSESCNQLKNELHLLKENAAEGEEKFAKEKEDLVTRIKESQDDLLSKQREVESLQKEKEAFETKVKGMEDMVIKQDTGLKEIVEAKNQEVDLLKDQGRVLSQELAEAQKSIVGHMERLTIAESNLEGSRSRFEEAEKILNDEISKKDSDISQKVLEIEELNARCREKISSLEEVQKALADLQITLKKTTELNEAKDGELENAKMHCSSLEARIFAIEKENLSLSDKLDCKNKEFELVNNKLTRQSEMMNMRFKELEEERSTFEDQLKAMHAGKSEGESQILDLMDKIHEITREKDEGFKSVMALKDEIEILNKRNQDSEDQIGSLENRVRESENEIQRYVVEKQRLCEENATLKEEACRLQSQVEDSRELLNRKLGEMEAASIRIQSFETEIEEAQNQKEELKLALDASEKKMEELVEQITKLKITFEEELNEAVTSLASVSSDLQMAREREASLNQSVSELERSISDKDETLKSTVENLNLAEDSKKSLQEQSQELDIAKSKLEERELHCHSLQKQVEELNVQLEKADQEFEAERDVVAARISESSSLLQTYEEQEGAFRSEIERLKEGSSKIEEVLLKRNEEFENVKEELESRGNEIGILKQSIEEKSKALEEYKVKVAKKIKSMKEEMKRMNSNEEELRVKEVRVSELESTLEELRQENQSIVLQAETYRHKILDIENLNVSREENLRNIETEMDRYHRLLQDKNEEVSAVKEMLQVSMEELQKGQEDVRKKEDKIKILQERLIANEEDLTASFTEKQNEIDAMQERMKQMRNDAEQKESSIVALSNDREMFMEKLQILETSREELAAENRNLLEKIELLSSELLDAGKSREDLVNEVLKLREDLAASNEKVPEDVAAQGQYQALVAEKEDLHRRLEAEMLENKERLTEIELLTDQLEKKRGEVESLKVGAKPGVSEEDLVTPFKEQIASLQAEADKKRRAIEEYKSKASKRLKSFKEENTSLQTTIEELNRKLEEQSFNASDSFSALEQEKELLSARLEELQVELGQNREKLETSIIEVEEFQTLVVRKDDEVDQIQTEAAKLKQRLNDKEEEIIAVKEMMHASINDIQQLQDEVTEKNSIISVLETRVQNSEDSLNSSLLSFNDELASLKEGHELKSKECEEKEEHLAEAKKQLSVLKDMLDSKNSEFDRLKEDLAKKESEGNTVDNAQLNQQEASAKRKDIAELEKESDAVKLKLAKAIKKLGTMKKDLQGKENMVQALEEQVKMLALSAENQEVELNASKENVDRLVIENARKDESLRAVEEEIEALRRRDRLGASEEIVPVSEVAVYADRTDGWSEMDSHTAEIPAIGSAQPVDEIVVAVEENLQGTGPADQTEETLKELISQLQEEKENMDLNLKKTAGQLEKAKKRIAALKKAAMTSGKENEELRAAIAEERQAKEATMSEWQSKVDELSVQCTAKETEISHLVQQVNLVKSELNEVSRLKARLEGKNGDLKKLVEAMAEEKHELDDEMKEMLVEIKDVMDIKNKLLNDLEESKQKLVSSEDEAGKLRSLLEAKEAEIVALEWKIQELEALKEELDEERDKNHTLNRDFAARSVKTEEFKRVLEIKEAELDALKEQLNNARDMESQQGDKISEVLQELAEKERLIESQPSLQAFEELKGQEDKLKGLLEVKDQEIMELRIANEKLEQQNKQQESLSEVLEEERQRSLKSVEEQELAMENLKLELSAVKEQLDKAREESEKLQGSLHNGELLEEELSKQKSVVVELNDVIKQKDCAIEVIQGRVKELQDAELELRRLLEEEVSTRDFLEGEIRKQEESFKEFDGEKSLLNAELEELRLNSSTIEASLNEEVKLLRERLEKEHEVASEKSKIEQEMLVKSVEDKSHSVEELEAKLRNLTESLESRNTVIGKLKLKLRNTIKDRDVMKGNLQSEIERVSQEKDVIFNEFQASAQQLEKDISQLKSHVAELETRNASMEKELENKRKQMTEGEESNGKALDELAKLRECSDVSLVEKSKLEMKIAALEKEIETKEEVIEKYEWETSEKEDRVRELEREVRCFQDRKDDWEELRRTFEETIEVKEKIMEGLQRDIENLQARKLQDSNLRTEEMNVWKEKNNKLEEELKVCEDQLKETRGELEVVREQLTPLEDVPLQILSVLGVTAVDYDKTDVCDVVSSFKESLETSLNAKDDRIKGLEEELRALQHVTNNAEEDFERLKEEQQKELDEFIQEIGAGENSSFERSLSGVLAFAKSERDALMQENTILSTNESKLEALYVDLQKKLEEEKKTFEEFKAMNYEEMLSSLNKQVTQAEERLLEAEEKAANLENEVFEVNQQLTSKNKIVDNLEREKEDLELKSSEIITSFDLLTLESKSLRKEKGMLENQLQLVTHEAEALRSSALPEMQAHLAAKNTAMLELRENFGEIMSEKDSVISTLRAKITELQQAASDGNVRSMEEIESRNSELVEKNDRIDKLSEEVAKLKKTQSWLQTELSQTITEKNNIGGSMQNQFEDISKGLRGDIELFMEEKRNFESEFHMERLQLERNIAEQEQRIKVLNAAIDSKDKEIMDMNFVVMELRRRVEVAADILSKESYYEQLEERVEESYKKVSEANASVRNAMDRVREEQSKVQALDMKLDSLNRERGELVLVYEGRLKKKQNDHAMVCQSLRTELEEGAQEKRNEVASLVDKIEEIQKGNKFAIDSLEKSFAEEKSEMEQRVSALTAELKILEQQKEDWREQLVNQMLVSADEKLVALRDEYEGILAEKNEKLKEIAAQVENTENKIASLTESNTTLAKSLFVLETQHKKQEKELALLNSQYVESKAKHKSEIEELLVNKGSDFKQLRLQFEEAFGEKEEILENLRNRVRSLSEQVEMKFQENNALLAEKEEFVEQGIKMDLLNEKLKVSIDSLLNSVFEIGDNEDSIKRHIQERSSTENEKEEEVLSRAESGTKDQPIEKGDVDFIPTIIKAKAIVDNHLRVLKGDADSVQVDVQEYFLLKEQLDNVTQENARLQNIISENSRKAEVEEKAIEIDEQETDSGLQSLAIEETSSSHVHTDTAYDFPTDQTEGDDLSDQKTISEDIVFPTTSYQEEAGNENLRDSHEVVTLKEQIAVLMMEREKARSDLQNVENRVRNDFDDILQNLREDLQNAMNENRTLTAENFMLKNVDLNRKELETSSLGDDDSRRRLDVRTQTVDESEKSGTTLKEALPKDAMASSQETSAQTDVSFVYQSADEFRRNGGAAEGDGIKRYSSSDRLPEVVEDSLYSKMVFEQLQTFSDSALEGDGFVGHSKLELRLGEDAEEGDKLASISDLQSEVEALNTQLEQGKKMIVKLKQMAKKYKTELSEVQAEKFEQVRVYEEAIKLTKQELDEANLEKVRKEQEIRSLREEVKVLVKEKAEIGDSVKLRMESIADDHRKTVSDLTAKNDQEFAKKEEVIRVLYNLRDDHAKKIQDLEEKLHQARETNDEMGKLNEALETQSDEKATELQHQLELLNEAEAMRADSESRLQSAEDEVTRLQAKLSVKTTDAAVENAKFDEQVLSDCVEELERSKIELEEAFDLIRAMEIRQTELEESYESEIAELSAVIGAHEETIAETGNEKLEIEKSMQEMREEVQRVVEEKDSIVERLRTEKKKVLEDNESKFNEKIEMSQNSISECQEEIINLRMRVEVQEEEIAGYKIKIQEGEDAARNATEMSEMLQSSLADVQVELEEALQSKNLVEDRLAFFEHQVEGMRNEHDNRVSGHQNELDKATVAIEALQGGLAERDQAILSLNVEMQSLKEEISRKKKRNKRLERDLETSKRSSQELSNGIKVEMEKVVDEMHQEKAGIYSDMLSKDRELQEIRVFTDHLTKEKEHWNTRAKETELLTGNGDSEKVTGDIERLSLQVSQFMREKEQLTENFELKVSQLTSELFAMERSKRERDLKVAELTAKLEHVQRQGSLAEKSEHPDTLHDYSAKVKGIKGDFEALKKEASGFADSSKMMLGNLQTELTELILSAAQKQNPQQPMLPVATPSSVIDIDARSLSPVERLSDGNGELEEAREQILMLEDSLQTWKDRCIDLEELLKQQGHFEGEEPFAGRRGSREFLINIDDDGPSIESARPGTSAQRLMKYSTSGMRFKTRARSLLSGFLGRQRGMLPVRRVLLMAYLLAIHVLAFMSIYGLFT